MDRERIFYLLDRHADGNWTTEEKQELEVYLLNSPEVQAWFWKHARLSTLVREACQHEAGREMAEIDSSTQAAPAAPAVPASLSSDSATSAGATAHQSLGLIGDVFSGGGSAFRFSLPRLLVLFTAMLLSSALTYWWINSRRGEATNSIAQSAPTAILVSGNNCRWDPTFSTGDMRNGARLGAGQSLCLIEGVAEIDCTLPSGGVGRFQLEGPASMMLNSEGMPNLKYGKLAAQISSGFGYMLETPMGRVSVPYEASIGVISNANEVELHTFDGDAFFEPPWPMAAGGVTEPMKIVGGASIRIRPSGSEGLSIHHGDANQDLFASQVSMAANRLEISDQYVATIRQAKPLAYWRFEHAEAGTVKNEMGDRLHCRIFGRGIGWHTYRGNRAVEFGASPETGSLMTEDTVDGLLDSSYSVELWVKPSHFHHGSLFSLAEWSPNLATVPGAGLLMELCGPVDGPVRSKTSWAYHPSRIRFLHRTPPGREGGTSCFSPAPYAVRKWQHFVALKEDSVLRLYVDGTLVASDQDRTSIAENMHVLIGQLHPHDPRRVVVERPFVGELDEIALYDRPLTETEIVEHYQLARPMGELPTDNPRDR